jgi:para-aminobenzoate synthetase/4-amino-4-deoxychorismate lyase
VLDKPSGRAQYGTGGGIVWDSTPMQEYDEMRAKTRILGNVKEQESVELFETLGWTAKSGFSRLQQHLQRMAHSAVVFGYAMDEQKARAVLEQAILGSAAEALRVRLSLNVLGEYRVDLAQMASGPQRHNNQAIRLAVTPVQSSDLFLLHKTTHRHAYEQANSEVPSGVEPVLFNERGEITESSIANVVYKLEGDWFTPPIESGLLPGVLRQELLTLGKVKLRELRVKELKSVQEVGLVNDLRGWRKARWV